MTRLLTRRGVAVVGSGPTGMMLAAELAIARCDVVVIERRRTTDLDSPRSRGLHARTLEVFDQRGIVDRFLSAGTPMQVQSFAGIPLDISDFPATHHYGLALTQPHVERIMSEWLEELGVPVRRECEVVGFSHDDDGVVLALSDGTTLDAQFLVGCDGGRSQIRKAAGIEFAGWDPTTCWITAEVETDVQPEFGLRGGGGIGPAEHGRVGVTLIEPGPILSTEPTLDDVRAALRRVDGTDYGARNPRYVSRFTDVTRQAVTYRAGRVLLAGDAAHVHPPLGGQGLNLGVQDAVNLGWKLAQVVAGQSDMTLLDTYEAERHPVAARVLRNTMAARALGATDERTGALRELVATMLAMDEPRRMMAGSVSGLDIAYDFGDGHPMLGRRVPDVSLVTATGPVRVVELLHDAKPVLIVLDGHVAMNGGVDPTRWVDRVRIVHATYEGPWTLPVIGPVAAPSAVLVRPDGHVAWVGSGTDDGLTRQLRYWFGEPNTPQPHSSH